MKLERLDAIRGLSAFYVFFHHARPLSVPGLSLLQFFGQESVAVFFVMSGFVIQYSVSSWKSYSVVRYFVHRFRRIYPLYIMALMLGGFVAFSNSNVEHPRWSLIASLLMFHDISALKPGIIFDPWMGNDPLWSLCYEWWFYCLYPFVIMLVPSAKRLFLVGLVGFLCAIFYHLFPSQVLLYISYFPLWWAGVEMASEFRECGAVTFSRQRFNLLLLFSLLLVHLLATTSWLVSGNDFSLGLYPFLLVRHCAFVLFAVIVAIGWRKCRWLGFDYIVMPWGRLAPISFGIYVFHKPVLTLFRSAGLTPWTVFVCSIPVVFTLAYFAERVLQPRINRLIK